MESSPVSSLLLLLLLFRGCSSQGPITCSAGTFVVGSTGSVTCYFNQNINATQNNFNVVMYSKAAGDSGTYVVLCNWTPSRQLECKVETGFSFNHKVTETLTMEIVDITQAAEGLYVCQVVPDNGIAVKTCNLSVQSYPEKSVTEVPREQEVETSQTHWYIITFLLLLLLATVVVLAVILFRNRRSIRLRPGMRSAQWQKGPEEEDIGLMSLTRINYPPNTANKSTHTYIVVMDNTTQIGNEIGGMSSNKWTQVGGEDHKFVSGNLKASKADIIMMGSADRFMNPTYTTLGTPPVVVPDHIVEKKKRLENQPQSPYAAQTEAQVS